MQDLNIGIALWLAAGGEGWVCEGHGHSSDEDYPRVRYKSKARILLVGSGADEQCAGYGRHRTKYRNARSDLLGRALLTNFGFPICKVYYMSL